MEVNFDENWKELAAQQRADEETEEINDNLRAFDRFDALDMADKQRIAADNHRKAIAGAGLIANAYKNGGMSSNALSAEFSEAFGQPILGGQLLDRRMFDQKGRPGTVLALIGQVPDGRGGSKIGYVGMMDEINMLKTINAAKLGDTLLPLQKRLYDDARRNLGLSPETLEAKFGVRNPSAPISTGGTVISGAGMRALRGEGRTRSRISTFSTNGEGGVTRQYSGPETGYQTVSVDSGTRREGAPAKWKILSSGPDGKRYENDQTGEVITVPEGQTIADATRVKSERERIADMNNLSREAIQEDRSATARETTKMNAEATRRKAEASVEAAKIRAAGQQPPKGDDEKQKNEGKGDKATTKKSDNIDMSTIPEFDSRRKNYKVGEKFQRNGKVYEVGSDGQPHIVK